VKTDVDKELRGERVNEAKKKVNDIVNRFKEAGEDATAKIKAISDYESLLKDNDKIPSLDIFKK